MAGRSYRLIIWGREDVQTKRSGGSHILHHDNRYPTPTTHHTFPQKIKTPTTQPGLAGISILALGGADVPALMSAVGSSAVGPLAKVVFAFPLVYHYGSGIRHFVSSNAAGAVGGVWCSISDG